MVIGWNCTFVTKLVAKLLASNLGSVLANTKSSCKTSVDTLGLLGIGINSFGRPMLCIPRCSLPEQASVVLSVQLPGPPMMRSYISTATVSSSSDWSAAATVQAVPC